MAVYGEDVPSTMGGVVCYGPGDYRHEDGITVPAPGPGEVLLKVSAIGICAGDAKCFAGAPRFWGDGRKTPRYVEPPVRPGHEFVGNVVALGEGAGEKHGISLGDQVTSEQICPCDVCRYCERGAYQMCIPHDVYGFHQCTQGAMADYVLLPARARNHKIDKSVPPEHAVYTEPLACSLHGVELGAVQFSDIVVVSGCGPIGLGMVGGVRQKSPKLLIALDLYDWKLEVAKKCGADVVLNPSKCDVVKEVMRLSGGYGCDVYIEATGHPNSVVQGLDMIARMGRFVEFSVFGKETTADWSIIGDCKELTIVGGHLSPRTFPKAISMIEKKQIPVEEIVTHRLPLSRVVEGIEMVNKSSESIKVILLPD